MGGGPHYWATSAPAGAPPLLLVMLPLLDRVVLLLQPSLGGDAKTLMFCNLSAEPESSHESLSSLRFAKKVNSTEFALSS